MKHSTVLATAIGLLLGGMTLPALAAPFAYIVSERYSIIKYKTTSYDKISELKFTSSPMA